MNSKKMGPITVFENRCNDTLVIPRVASEIALHVLACNLAGVMTIVGHSNQVIDANTVTCLSQVIGLLGTARQDPSATSCLKQENWKLLVTSRCVRHALKHVVCSQCDFTRPSPIADGPQQYYL